MKNIRGLLRDMMMCGGNIDVLTLLWYCSYKITFSRSTYITFTGDWIVCQNSILFRHSKYNILENVLFPFKTLSINPYKLIKCVMHEQPML